MELFNELFLIVFFPFVFSLFIAKLVSLAMASREGTVGVSVKDEVKFAEGSRTRSETRVELVEGGTIKVDELDDVDGRRVDDGVVGNVGGDGEIFGISGGDDGNMERLGRSVTVSDGVVDLKSGGNLESWIEEGEKDEDVKTKRSVDDENVKKAGAFCEKSENYRVDDEEVGNIRDDGVNVQDVGADDEKDQSVWVDDEKFEKVRDYGKDVENSKVVQNLSVGKERAENIRGDDEKIENVRVHEMKINKIRSSGETIESNKVDDAIRIMVDDEKIENFRADDENFDTNKADDEKIGTNKADDETAKIVGVDDVKVENTSVDGDNVQDVSADNENIKNDGVDDENVNNIGVVDEIVEISKVDDENAEQVKVDDDIIINSGSSAVAVDQVLESGKNNVSGISNNEIKGQNDEKSLIDDDEWEGIESSELEEAFAAASNYVFNGEKDDRRSNLDSDVQMQLYGLDKVVMEGPCHEPQPMALKLSARAKWNAWQRLGNMSPEVAMEQYVTLLSDKVPGWMEGKSLDGGSKDSSGVSEASPSDIGTCSKIQPDPMKVRVLELNSITDEGDMTGGSNSVDRI